MVSNIDVLIVFLYLLTLFAWAIYIGLRETADDFLVLSRRAPFLLVTFSVISTWVGIGTTVATAASGYDKGISLGFTASTGGGVGILVAAWFAPRLKWFGDKYKAHTLGDFFLIRYSKINQLGASGLIFLVYLMLTAAQLVGLGTLVQVWTGAEFEIVVVFAALSTVVYTAFAGIKSDFYTDVVHFFVMFIVLFVVLLPITLKEIGGITQLLSLPDSYFNPFAYGGVSFFIAGIIFGAGSVFVTMELWQRVYASSSGRVARNALASSIVVIIAFYAISAFFGMSASLLIPNIPNRDQALFFLMKNYLPVGFLGFGLAGFMAVFISTINSTIMVASATLTKDFYFGYQGKGNLLIAGRISTLIVGILGMALAMIVPDLVALSVNSLFMLLILIPSVVGGFFWRRATASGAFWSVVLGAIVMFAFFYTQPETAFVPGFLVSLIVFIAVSMFTKHRQTEDLTIISGFDKNMVYEEPRGTIK